MVQEWEKWDRSGHPPHYVARMPACSSAVTNRRQWIGSGELSRLTMLSGRSKRWGGWKGGDFCCLSKCVVNCPGDVSNQDGGGCGVQERVGNVRGVTNNIVTALVEMGWWGLPFFFFLKCH